MAVNPKAPTVMPDQQRMPLVQPSRLWERVWFEWFLKIFQAVQASVVAVGTLTLNQLLVGDGGNSLKALAATQNGQVPIGATDGTVEFQTVTAGANISVTNGAHSITVAATGVVTGAAGANTDIQYNDAGAFGGDAGLTWDKTNKVETVTGTPSYTPIVTPNTGGQLTSLGGPNQGFSVGSKVIGGVEIAQQANQGYAFFDGGTPVASLGFSTGETPGSPTAYTQWQELHVLPDRSADVVGDDTAGAIPGKSIGATRNAAGAGAASTLHGQQRGGTDWFEWQDATGRLRYGPSRPTEDNSVSDTSGTQIGTGDGTVTHTAGALTANELLVGNGSADIKTVAATDGQIPIGKSSDGSVTLATLTAGANITITNAGGSITIAASGGSTTGGSTLIGLDRLLGDGSTTTFNLADLAEYVVDVSDAGSTVDPTLYTLSSDLSQITFGTAPTAGHVLTFEYVVAQLAA